MNIHFLDNIDSAYRYSTCLSAYTFVIDTETWQLSLYGWDCGLEDAEYYAPNQMVMNQLKRNEHFASAVLETMSEFLAMKNSLPPDTRSEYLENISAGMALNWLREELGITFAYLLGREVSLDRLVQL